MKWSIIIMFILMIVSFVLASMFFFNSGFFDFQSGQVTHETIRIFLSELNTVFNSTSKIPGIL